MIWKGGLAKIKREFCFVNNYIAMDIGSGGELCYVNLLANTIEPTELKDISFLAIELLLIIARLMTRYPQIYVPILISTHLFIKLHIIGREEPRFAVAVAKPPIIIWEFLLGR